MNAYFAGSARLAKLILMVATAGLVALVTVVTIQVIGRYVFNATPVWAERGALLIVLYMALLAAAVGVRDAGHLGMESLLVLAPPGLRRWLEGFIQLCVGGFGALMCVFGARLAESVRTHKIATIGISEAFTYLPLVMSGALIAWFALEHIVALVAGRKVTPAWH